MIIAEVIGSHKAFSSTTDCTHDEVDLKLKFLVSG